MGHYISPGSFIENGTMGDEKKYNVSCIEHLFIGAQKKRNNWHQIRLAIRATDW